MVDERARHDLYRRLEDVLGPDQATTLMAHLPPVGWADVASKHDLHALGQRLDARVDALGQRLDARVDALEQHLEVRIDTVEQRLLAAFRGELVTAIASQTRAIVFAVVGSVLATASLAFAAAGAY